MLSFLLWAKLQSSYYSHSKKFMASTRKEIEENEQLDKMLKIRKIRDDTPYSVVPLTSKPQVLTCPHCHHYVTTEILVKPSIRTHLKALILCLCCFFFIPYMMPSCMNVDHFCPECETYIGTYIG